MASCFFSVRGAYLFYVYAEIMRNDEPIPKSRYYIHYTQAYIILS